MPGLRFTKVKLSYLNLQLAKSFWNNQLEEETLIVEIGEYQPYLSIGHCTTTKMKALTWAQKLEYSCQVMNMMTADQSYKPFSVSHLFFQSNIFESQFYLL
jgi:hypothetical protein